MLRKLKSSEYSELFKNIFLFHHETHDESDTRKNHSYEPEAHNDGFFGPSDSFEMVVKRSDSEDFFPVSEFFGNNLNDNRTDFENIDSGDNKENRESIGHHRHDSEICAECKRTDIAHIEFSGFYIEPEKCDERSDDEHTNGRENKKTMDIGNKSIYDIIKEQKSASKSIESIGHINRICHSDDNENEKRDIENTKTHVTEKRKMKSGVPEFYIEPICSKSCEYHEKNHLYSCRKSFCSSDSANIHIIVHESDKTDYTESSKGEICFISVPETVFDLNAEKILNIDSEKMNDNRNDNE